MNTPPDVDRVAVTKEFPVDPRQRDSIWAFVAVAPAAALSFAWYYLHLAPGVVFGPWQGLLVQPEPLSPMPYLSHLLAQRLQELEHGAHLWRLNLASAVFGALACAALAMIAHLAFRRMLPGLAAAGAALAVALLFAVLPPMLYASTGTGPTTLTLFLALLSLAAFLVAMARGGRGFSIFVCGLAAGLAAANHPSFALLGFAYVFGVILAGREAEAGVERVLALLVAFVVGATLPLFSALAEGGTLRGFLAQALATPYPMIGDAPPEWLFGARLFEAVPLWAFLLVIPGGVLLFRHGSRLAASAALLLFLIFGPLLPLLTNHSGVAQRVHDDAASFLAALAFITLFLTAGVLYFVTPRPRPGASVGGWPRHAARAAAFGVAVLLLGYAFSANAPDRQHDWAEQLAGAMLEPLPEQSVVMSGDPLITSLLLSAQSTGIREDVTVLPASQLVQPGGRARLNSFLGEEFLLPIRFPADDALDRWRQQLPFHFSALTEFALSDATQAEAFLPFALWDLVGDNFGERTIAFAGLAPEWLTARAQTQGLFLHYPPPAVSIGRDIPVIHPPDSAPDDPLGAQTLSLLLLPLSANARNQAHPELAQQLAELAIQYAPRQAQPRHQLLSAQARSGEREAMLAAAENYLRRHPDPVKVERLEQAITLNLSRLQLENELHAYLENIEAADPELELRQEVFDPLWEHEEFALLVVAYERILKHQPHDLDALYQLAAAHAQLGAWEAADVRLGEWVEVGGFPLEELLRQIDNDGRFAHFHEYRRHTFIPPRFRS